MPLSEATAISGISEDMIRDIARRLAAVKPVMVCYTLGIPDDEYPFVLSTGRRLYHYHTRTQTGRCEGLNDLLGQEFADISIADASALGIDNMEVVKVASRRGEIRVRARVTEEVPQGMVWMAFHFREGNANWLTNPAFDPNTLTAEYKACAVNIEKIA